MGKYELSSRFDSRQSFYGKAVIEEEGKTKKLYSYNTLVAETLEYDTVAKVYNTQSQTTVRHVKEFLKQCGFKADNKKQIVKDYFVEE